MAKHRDQGTRSYRGSADSVPGPRLRLRAVIAVLLLGGAAYAGFAGPLFRIHYIDARVPETCEAAVADSVPLESNLLLLDASAVESVISGDPLVADVAVRKVLPDTVKIETVLREGVLRVQSGDRYLEVDREGVAFRPAVGAALPLLGGVESVSHPGDKVSWDAVETALVWLDALPRYSLPPVVRVDYLGGGLCEMVLEDGRVVKTGDSSEADRKLAAAEAILAHWPEEIEYVDVAITTQPVVGEVQQPETDPSEETPNVAPSAEGTGDTDDSSDGQLITDAQL